MPRKYTDEQFVEAISTSCSIRQVLKKLGLKEAGGNYSCCKNKISKMELDTSHFGNLKERQGWSKGKKFPGRNETPLEDLLVLNSNYQSFKLKNRLIKAGAFELVCSKCRLTEWLGEPIPLELDHMNGNNRDNRKENLRLLCPNCHATTPNYRGKNKNMAQYANGKAAKLKPL